MRRLGACLVLAVLASPGCDEDPSNPGGAGPDPLPPLMDLTGTASLVREDGKSASCSIFLRIELEDEGELENGAWTYRGTAGGEAQRDVSETDTTGLSFWPLLHSGATVRATADSIELMADGYDTVSVRFYQGIMHFRAARTGAAAGNGAWTCAPLDLNSDGWLDTSVVAPGAFTIVEGEE